MTQLTTDAQSELIPAIEFRDISVHFLDPQDEVMVAVKDVSFSVEPGTFTSIIGPSGCGKTTLLRLLAGLESPTEGKTLYAGKEVAELNTDIGYITQDSNLFPWMTVRENIEFPLEMRGVGAAERRRKSQHFIDLIGLTGFEQHYPHQLSGGMQKRVSVARTLCYEPQIVLMDEPFSALDAQTRMALQSDLQKMWAERKQTTLLVTHDLTEAIALSDKIVIMSHRPGTVKSIFDVPIPRPRDIFDIQASPEFGATYNAIWEPLKGEVLATAPAEDQESKRSRKGLRRSTPISVLVWRLAIVLAVLVGWEIAVNVGALDQVIFSKPTEIISQLWHLLQNRPAQGIRIYDQISVTVQEWAVGYGIGVSVATAAGFLLGRSRYLSQIVQPLILIFYGLPIIAIAPLFLVILGIGFSAKVATAVVITFFACFFQVYSGVSSIPEVQIQLARLMGASRFQLIKRILIPASLTFVFTGLRIAVPLTMTGAIIGEFVSSSSGLGWFILRTSATLDSPDLFATLFILMFIVFGFGQIIRYIETKALRWQPKATNAVGRGGV